MSKENSPSKYKNWFHAALAYFILAGLFGVLMRYAFVGDLPDWMDFKNIRHGHSHMALLGWLHAGLYIFIVYLFNLRRDLYRNLYWSTQATVFGMFVSFPIVGYKGISIVFVTLFVFLSYLFIYAVFKDLKTQENDNASLFLKTSLFFLFLSSLGTWSLAAIMSTMKGSALYYGAIQFYLHFQFNGWLVFGVLALFFKILEFNKIKVDQVKVRKFYWWLLISCFLTFAIAISWSTPLPVIFWINSLGVIVQLLALVYFMGIILEFNDRLKEVLHSKVYMLLAFSLLSFIVKIVIQAMVVIPHIATVSYGIRNFVIGYIHLLMLGCLSSFFIALYQKFFAEKQAYGVGIKIFVLGVVLSECLLFFQGVMLWFELGFLSFYYNLIFALSILMPLGVLIYFLGILRKKV